jgi:hypothetical protein
MRCVNRVGLFSFHAIGQLNNRPKAERNQAPCQLDETICSQQAVPLLKDFQPGTEREQRPAPLPPHIIGIIPVPTKAGDASRRGGNGEQQIEVACRSADTR